MTYSPMEIATTVAVVLAGCSHAQADEAAMIELMRQNGCVAAEPPVFNAMAAQALGTGDYAENAALTRPLLDDRKVWLEHGIGAVLHPRHCGSNAHLLGHQTEGQQLLIVIRANGCRLDEADAERLLAPLASKSDRLTVFSKAGPKKVSPFWIRMQVQSCCKGMLADA